MSNSKRRSTVHDFSSLRLHPDGTRVPLSQTAPKARHAKYTVQDHRGNWIAQDASGVDRVKTRRAAAKEQEEAREDEDGDVDESQVAGPSRTGEDKGKGRAVDDDEDVHELKDARAKRRKLFHEDVRLHGLGVRAAATLEEQPLPSGGSSPARVVQPAAFSQPNPSSDLLKCIHYFASTYYSEMGQLRDSSKEYRKEKKLRRLKRLQKQADRKAAAAQSDQKAGDGEDESSATSSSEEEETESEDESTTSKAPTSKKGSRNVRRAKALAGADMYKIFDGSALMAIGMLLQHHVDELVTPHVPEGWEEEMDGVGTERPERQRRKDRMVKDRSGEDYVAVGRPHEEDEELDGGLKAEMFEADGSDDEYQDESN